VRREVIGSRPNKNRELSIQIAAAPVVSAIEKTFDSDFVAAPAWKKASS